MMRVADRSIAYIAHRNNTCVMIRSYRENGEQGKRCTEEFDNDSGGNFNDDPPAEPNHKSSRIGWLAAID